MLIIFANNIFKMVRKGGLIFLAREIEPHFLIRMICYKWYFRQVMTEYEPKQNVNGTRFLSLTSKGQLCSLKDSKIKL